MMLPGWRSPSVRSRVKGEEKEVSGLAGARTRRGRGKQESRGVPEEEEEKKGQEGRTDG